MKKNNKKGFTLAELLIVVAIIAVLTAIAIPVFTQQLERSKEATDMSNVRAAYAEVVTSYLGDGKSHSATVKVNQTKANWQTDNDHSTTNIGTDIKIGSKNAGAIKVTAKTTGSYTVKINKSGTVADIS